MGLREDGRGCIPICNDIQMKNTICNKRQSYLYMYQYTCSVQYDSLRCIFWVCLIGALSAKKSTDFAKRSEYELMR